MCSYALRAFSQISNSALYARVHVEAPHMPPHCRQFCATVYRRHPPCSRVKNFIFILAALGAVLPGFGQRGLASFCVVCLELGLLVWRCARLACCFASYSRRSLPRGEQPSSLQEKQRPAATQNITQTSPSVLHRLLAHPPRIAYAPFLTLGRSRTLRISIPEAALESAVPS